MPTQSQDYYINSNHPGYQVTAPPLPVTTRTPMYPAASGVLDLGTTTIDASEDAVLPIETPSRACLVLNILCWESEDEGIHPLAKLQYPT